jgi:hypothetical protein
MDKLKEDRLKNQQRIEILEMKLENGVTSPVTLNNNNFFFF